LQLNKNQPNYEQVVVKRAQKKSFLRSQRRKENNYLFGLAQNNSFFESFFCWPSCAFSPWVWIPAWIQSDPETKKSDMVLFRTGI